MHGVSVNLVLKSTVEPADVGMKYCVLNVDESTEVRLETAYKSVLSSTLMIEEEVWVPVYSINCTTNEEVFLSRIWKTASGIQSQEEWAYKSEWSMLSWR